MRHTWKTNSTLDANRDRPLDTSSKRVAVAHARVSGANYAQTSLIHPFNASDSRITVIDGTIHSGGEEWEFREEKLPEGSTLSSSKSIIEEYPEGETPFKKSKKPKTCKGAKGNNKFRL